MKLNPRQLTADLRSGVRPVYMVSGDEPLLMQEACDAIRAAVREAGFSERELFHVDAAFEWQQLGYSTNSMSLFGDRKLIELRMPTGKPGTRGASALQEFVEKPPEDRVLLIITERLERGVKNSAWFKRASAAGAYVEVRPIDLGQMPRWLNERIRRAGMRADREAVHALIEKVEGNLLAAVQEIERIRLITGGGQIDIGMVTDEVGDSARYTIFGLIDAALSGDGKRTLRVLQGLQDEGVALLQISFFVGRELRRLAVMRAEVATGRSVDSVMRANRVWSTRARRVGAALGRHDAATFDSLLLRLAKLDKLAKGGDGENPWDLMRDILARLAGIELVTSVPVAI